MRWVRGKRHPKQEGTDRAPNSVGEAFLFALSVSGRWAIPSSLLVLGFLQGASYIRIIGDDFVRYWATADAMSSLQGYPAMVQGIHQEGGAYRYSIEFPVFPLLLLASFLVAGRDTLGACLPALLANTALPWLLYAFFARAGLQRPLAFSAACLLTVFPLLRLHTLNPPLPDAVFMALLVATGLAFLSLDGPSPREAAVRDGETGRRGDAETGTRGDGETGTRGDGETRGDGDLSTQSPALSPQSSPPRTQHPAQSSVLSPQPSASGARRPTSWLVFGLLAGAISLTRPEGLLFVGAMFTGLVPSLREVRFRWATGAFLAMVLPFSLVMIRTIGMPWPGNTGTSFRLGSVAANLEWLSPGLHRWCADLFGLSETAFFVLVALLALLALIGSLWMALERWRTALLPISAGFHTLLVLTIDPGTADAGEWFDVFRPVSYGLPFLALALLLPIQRLVQQLPREDDARASSSVGRGKGASRGERAPRFPYITPSSALALLTLAMAAYLLHLLVQPPQSPGSGAGSSPKTGALVSFGDIVENRYPLPGLPLVQQAGILLVDSRREQFRRDLDGINAFFEPVATAGTGRGSQYQLPSLLAMLFGMVFALGGQWRRAASRRQGSAGGAPGHGGPPTAPRG